MNHASSRPSEDFNALIDVLEQGAENVDSSGCPSPDRIWDAANLQRSPAEQRELLLHVATCPACARDWRIARSSLLELQEQSPLLETKPSPKVVSIFARRRKLLGGSLLAVAAAGCLLLLRTPGRIAVDPHAEFRGDEGAILDLSDYQLQKNSFSWPESPGAESYEILIYDTNLDQMRRLGPVSSQRLELSPEDTSELMSAGAMYWRVIAKTKNGQEKNSPPIQFHLSTRTQIKK